MDIIFIDIITRNSFPKINEEKKNYAYIFDQL